MFKKCSVFAKCTKNGTFDCGKYLCLKSKKCKEILKNQENEENVHCNKKYANVRNYSKTNIFGFDVSKISW